MYTEHLAKNTSNYGMALLDIVCILQLGGLATS